MPDDVIDPTVVPVVPVKTAAPARGRRTALLLGVAAGAGLIVGVLLTVSVFMTHRFITQTLPETRDSVQVFEELNELRQQINQLNEDNKRKEQEKEDAVRQALNDVASAARVPKSSTPDARPPAKKEGMAKDARPVERRRDEFAEVDEEIERLQRTEKVLNNILDLFTRKGKKPPKEP
jgi:hypothetical protein